MLIGDPKQAIYAFRGADVHAYLPAQRGVQSEWTLDVNWRSDQGSARGLRRTLRRSQLGYAGIAYRSVERGAAPTAAPAASARRSQRRCACGSLHTDDGLVRSRRRRACLKAGDARGVIARDLAADVVKLLSRRPDASSPAAATEASVGGAAASRPRRRAGAGQQPRRAGPRRAARGRRARRDRRLRARCSRTAPAREWLRLLEALERPTARDRASLAALTVSSAGPPTRWPRLEECQWEDLHWSLHRWAALLRDQGVASLFETVSRTHGVPGRVLGRGFGRALHDRPAPHRPAAPRGRRVRRARPDRHGDVAGPADPRRRHATPRTRNAPAGSSRMPTRSRSSPSTAARASSFPSSSARSCGTGGRTRATSRCSTTPPTWTSARSTSATRERDFAIHQKMELDESRGEDLRLLYVALTRAQHQAVLWWAGVQDSQHSPLARLLFDRGPSGLVAAVRRRSAHRRRDGCRLRGARRPGLGRARR